ncbi:MAG: DUF2764 family protein [Treponemataceae bacterium]
MANYYYVMAQLPAIIPGERPVLTYKKFLSLVEDSVSKEDNRLLKELSLVPNLDGKKTGVAFLDRWAEYEHSLRSALAKARAEKLNWAISKEDMNRLDMDEALDIKKIAREASAIDDPLEAEQFLNKARVSAILKLQGFSNFNRDALFAYAIALLVQTRELNFDTEAGRNEYKAIYDKILEK